MAALGSSRGASFLGKNVTCFIMQEHHLQSHCVELPDTAQWLRTLADNCADDSWLDPTIQSSYAGLLANLQTGGLQV